MKKKKKTVLIVILVLLVLGSLGNLVDKSDSKSDEAAETTASADDAAALDLEETDADETAQSGMYFGEQLSVIDNGEGVCVLKYKINSQITNNVTIKQNYYTVCSFIEDGQADGFDELQYWAIADTRDGDETKAISFTVPADVIQKVKDGKINGYNLEDYLVDLWILPSLLS